MVITSKEKKSTTFIFKQILNSVCVVFLKIDTHGHGLDRQSAIDMQIQLPKEIRTRCLGTAHCTKALFL